MQNPRVIQNSGEHAVQIKSMYIYIGHLQTWVPPPTPQGSGKQVFYRKCRGIASSLTSIEIIVWHPGKSSQLSHSPNIPFKRHTYYHGRTDAYHSRHCHQKIQILSRCFSTRFTFSSVSAFSVRPLTMILQHLSPNLGGSWAQSSFQCFVTITRGLEPMHHLTVDSVLNRKDYSFRLPVDFLSQNYQNQGGTKNRQTALSIINTLICRLYLFFLLCERNHTFLTSHRLP